MKRTLANKTLSFRSKLERISDEKEYFAISVPAKVNEALGTKGPVPVSAQLNDGTKFLVSLFPVGEGRHYMRLKASVRKEAKIEEGSVVRVKITPIDRTKNLKVPKDLLKAVKAEGITAGFDAIPLGQKTFMIRKLEEAAKPETREKRIQDILKAAHERAYIK